MTARNLRLAPVLAFLALHVFVLALLLLSSFDVYDLMLVYYIELIVIGVYALLRLLAAVVLYDLRHSGRLYLSFGARVVYGLFLTGVFVGKYGALMLGLGILIVMLPNETGMTWVRLTDVHPIVEWCLWIMLVRYAVVFLWAVVLHSDYRGESTVRLLLHPYLRALWVAAAIGVGLIAAARRAEDVQLYFTLGVFATRLIPDFIGTVFETRAAAR